MPKISELNVVERPVYEWFSKKGCNNATLEELDNSQPKVVSTFASPHEPMQKPKAYKRASASPAQVAHKALGFAVPQKNKINLCFVDRLCWLIKILKQQLNN